MNNYTISNGQSVKVQQVNFRYKAYGKILRALTMLVAAIYELAFNEPAPPKDERY